MRLFRALLICFALLTAGHALAQERILNYDVTIDVQKNADLIVTENITVNSEGRSIRRGIFRDLPRYKIDDGDTIPYQYKILSVTKNGETEPFEDSSVGNAERIRIGDADVFLDNGIYDYVIKYRVKNEIRYRETEDELYWNVTGSYWNFPIERASATITLPQPATSSAIKEINGYAGRSGTSDIATNVTQQFDSVVIETVRGLAPREGLTVSVIFDKGIVDPPTVIDKTWLWWFKHGALFLLSFSLVWLLAYYWLAWNKVGRDPAKLPVYPRYAPPAGLSAAAVHRLTNRMGVNNDAATATLMSLAVKGAIKIKTTKKTTQFENLGLQAVSASAPLLFDEQYLYNRLFTGADKTLTLKGKTHKGFSKAHTAFNSQVTKIYGEDYFKWNAGYTVGGVMLSAAAIGAALTQVYGSWKPGFAVVLAALIALNILFLFLMPAPTRKGEAIVSEIEGFKLYLKTAESKRFANKISENPSEAPPTMTQDLYERYLPYAVALDVEKPWSKYFEKMLPELADNYDPSWGRIHHSRGGASGFSKSLSSNISSGVSSAAPQSSGSGGGGGGSSGGGGGGGGGGGW